MTFHTIAIGSLIWASLITVAAFGQPAESKTDYNIDSGDSILRVYVGRAGPLARLGHNHVIHTRAINGRIELADNPLNSSARFSFPVSSFVVDDQSERDRAGEGFESQPGESAIEDTRENMLGADVLNATKFGEISIIAAPVSTDDSDWLLAVDINFLGATFSQELPAQVTIADSQLDITANFTLQHEDLELSPFSALGGSLRVAEAIDFELQISANMQ
ncbi:MAG: hypothetical protein PsegKO_19160 [Pseudohongiellaceae bacterium]